MATGEHPDILLSIDHLCVDYLAGNGTVHAVNDVSLTLKRGEIIGLAGESGCGKSTLAFAIARLLRPPAVITDGEVLYYPRLRADHGGPAYLSTLKSTKNVKGQFVNADDPQDGEALEPFDILQLSLAQLRAFRWNDLAIVFQSAMNSLNPVMNIGKQIMDVFQAHRSDVGPREARERAVELLKMVGIAPDRLKSYPHELSGGMRQRAAIAIALALKPDLIIMDEPTTALDVVVQREILELISGLARELGTSLIFITHDLSLLLEMADQIAVMYAGKIIEQASNRDLYAHARHPYSYGLLSSFPSLHGPRRKMMGIPGSPLDLRIVPPGCPFVDRCPFAFEPCPSNPPLLRPATSASPEQVVACHLYNTNYRPTIPDSAELAHGYEVLAEGKTVR